MSKKQSKSTVWIDSRDRHSVNTNPNEFCINFSRAKFPGIKGIEIGQVNMDMRFDNFDSTNNLIHFEDSGPTAFTATIPAGFYPRDSSNLPTALLAALDTAMDATASSDTYTSSYNANTNRITIAQDVGTFELILSNRSSAAWDLLGYSSSTDTVAATSHLATNSLNLSHPEYIDIRSHTLSSLLDGNMESDGVKENGGELKYSQLVYRVYNDSTDYNQKIPIRPPTTPRVIGFANEVSMKEMDFCTFDPNGNKAQHNGGEWWMELTLNHEENSQNKETEQKQKSFHLNKRFQGF